MGEIGPIKRVIEVLPIDEPVVLPDPEPVEQPAEPDREPEKEPVG